MWTRSQTRATLTSPVIAPNVLSVSRRGSVRSRLSKFADDAAGEVMVMFGLMAVAMFMMIGLAVDTGRWLNARDQTMSAIDAAVLAAGRALQTGSSAEEAKTVAQKYYAEAVKNRLTVMDDSITFIIVDSGTAVQAQGKTHIRTPFMSFGGVKKLPLIKDTAADQAKAVVAVGRNAGQNTEISLMLDVSGSMCNKINNYQYDQPCTIARKLDALKTAAKDLIDTVVWNDQGHYSSKVAIVPFSADVRPPDSLQAALVAGAGNRSHQSGTKTYYFAPTTCAAERSGTDAYTDAAPSGSNLLNRIYSQVSNSSTTTGACAIAAGATIVPMTSDKTVLKAAIDGLIGQGGTAGHLGTAWAYYMLSPNWSSLLTGDASPAAYGADKTKKIAILMTDGEYNHTYEKLKNKSGGSGSVYNPAAAVSTSSAAGSGDTLKSINGKSSAYQAMQICTKMKANGIEVYTVGFELPNQTAIDTLKNCATDPTHAYTADNVQQLQDAFKDIAVKTVKLHLSQ